MKTFKWDGKRIKLPDTIPVGQIEWIVARYHVNKTELEIEVDMSRRMAKWEGVSELTKEKVYHYALFCHDKNKRLYNAIVMGLI